MFSLSMVFFRRAFTFSFLFFFRLYIFFFSDSSSSIFFSCSLRYFL